MLMGRMMAMIQGRREAEDDEHTEVSALKTFFNFFFLKKTEYAANLSPVRYIGFRRIREAIPFPRRRDGGKTGGAWICSRNSSKPGGGS